MWISDTVFLIEGRIVCSNSILVRRYDFKLGIYKQILIDPGTTRWDNLHSLLYKLKIGTGLSKIDEIWATHAHPDHVQAAQALKLLNPQTKLSAHPIAKRILENPHPIIAFLCQQKESISPLLKTLFKENIYKPKIINGIMLALSRWGANIITTDWHKVKIDHTFKNGEIINGIKVIYLPGHTPEEVGFFIQDEEILITGDLLTQRNGMPRVALNVPASDIDTALKSLKIMQQFNPKLIIPAHGRIIRNPKSVISKCIEMTQGLRAYAYDVLRTASSPYQVLAKYSILLPTKYSLEQRLNMLGVLAKSAMM